MNLEFGNQQTYLRSCPCPSCGTAQSTPAISSSPPAQKMDFPSLKESWFGFFKKKVFFSYHRCVRCGQLYSPTYFTDDALSELYRSMPDNTAGLEDVNLERTQKGYFDLLSKHGVAAGDFLELGPDIGLFTQYPAKSLSVKKLWLYEPNVAVHPQLAGRTHGRPYEIRNEMKDFSSVPDGSVSLCVMIHVLDHLPDALPLMRQIARKLQTGGLLLIVTHDERSLIARTLRSRWPAYCLQHPHLFNKDSTRKFLGECGLDVIETVRTTNHFPAFYLLRHLFFALGLGSLWKTPRYGPVLPVKLGNIATIARLETTQD